MNTKNDKPARLMEWKESLALAFDTSRGYIKEGIKPRDVMSYKDFMEYMQNSYEHFVKDKPQLDEDNVYIELYEGEDHDSEVVFTWLEPESDASYKRRCEEINRLNEVKVAAEKMELIRRITENPELAKEILNNLSSFQKDDMVVMI
jgi:hypothetical protein